MEQFRLLKAADPKTKVWLYRGTIYAYPWYAETRKILDDPAYSPWFLKFKPTGPYVSPKCDVNGTGKCTDYYHTQEQTPMYPAGPDNRGQCAPPGCDCGTKPCGFYMYNHSAANVVVKGQTLREWFLDSYIFHNADGVDGFYFDDYWNVDKTPVTEDYAQGMVEDVGLTHAQLLDITIEYNATIKALYNRTLAAGKIGWQMCYGGAIYETREHKVTKANCAASLRLHCAADSPTQHRAYLAAPRDHKGLYQTKEDLANFLLIRGDYAWFGYGWVGCGYQYPALPEMLNADYGEPTALCSETAPALGGAFNADDPRVRSARLPRVVRVASIPLPLLCFVSYPILSLLQRYLGGCMPPSPTDGAAGTGGEEELAVACCHLAGR
eukprot:gene1447-biopygen87120